MDNFPNLRAWMLLSYLVLFQLPFQHFRSLLLLHVNPIQLLILYQNLLVSFVYPLLFNLFRLLVSFGLTRNEGNLVVNMQGDVLSSDALLKRMNRLHGVGASTVYGQLRRLTVGVGQMVTSDHKLLRRRRQIVAPFPLTVAEVKILLLRCLSARLSKLGSIQIFDGHFFLSVEAYAVSLIGILTNNFPFGRCSRPASDSLDVLQTGAYSQFGLSSHEFKFQQQRVSDQMCFCAFKCLFKLCSQLPYILIFFARSLIGLGTCPINDRKVGKLLISTIFALTFVELDKDEQKDRQQSEDPISVSTHIVVG